MRSPARSSPLATSSNVPSKRCTLRDGLALGLAQRVGLRLAATFGHGLSKVGKQHGEPEPQRDLEIEAEGSTMMQRCCRSAEPW